LAFKELINLIKLSKVKSVCVNKSPVIEVTIPLPPPPQKKKNVKNNIDYEGHLKFVTL